MATARKTTSKVPTQKAKSVTVVLDTPQEKKNTVRYDNKTKGAAMSTAYVSKTALEILGNPQKIKITIESA
jgi:hypothetical protein